MQIRIHCLYIRMYIYIYIYIASFFSSAQKPLTLDIKLYIYIYIYICATTQRLVYTQTKPWLPCITCTEMRKTMMVSQADYEQPILSFKITNTHVTMCLFPFGLSD